jgi:hypothetical protein
VEGVASKHADSNYSFLFTPFSMRGAHFNLFRSRKANAQRPLPPFIYKQFVNNQNDQAPGKVLHNQASSCKFVFKFDTSTGTSFNLNFSITKQHGLS